MLTACSDSNNNKTDSGTDGNTQTDSNTQADSTQQQDTAQQNDPEVGKTFKQQITASEGGTLKTESGNATLDIPAGALPADKELTVAVEAATTDTETSVYNFGPDGTTFEKPVKLSLKYTGTPGTGKKAVLAVFENNAWKPIEGSTVENGTVVGEITHFSKFSIVVIGNEIVAISSCSEVSTKFVPCGENGKSIVGTWKFKDVCFSDALIGQNPYGQVCSGASISADISWTGTATFNATTVILSERTQVVAGEATIPKSCLTAIGKASCDEFKKENDIMFNTCTDDGTNCKCTGSETKTESASTQPYTISGTNLVINGNNSPFCLVDNTATVEIPVGGSGSTIQKIHLVLEKQ